MQDAVYLFKSNLPPELREQTAELLDLTLRPLLYEMICREMPHWTEAQRLAYARLPIYVHDDDDGPIPERTLQ